MDFPAYIQTFYYLVASLAILVLGVLGAVIAFHLIRITKSLEHISDNLDEASEELTQRLENIINRLASLPILRYFLNDRGGRTSRRLHHK